LGKVLTTPLLKNWSWYETDKCASALD
jgi:hypothetical protein